jgi:hypothetical protein
LAGWISAQAAAPPPSLAWKAARLAVVVAIVNVVNEKESVWGLFSNCDGS